MNYTLRNVPPDLDHALRRRAQEEKKSLNEVALEALLQAFALRGEELKRRDLSDVAGTWIEDPEVDRALEEQREIGPELVTEHGLALYDRDRIKLALCDSWKPLDEV